MSKDSERLKLTVVKDELSKLLDKIKNSIDKYEIILKDEKKK